MRIPTLVLLGGSALGLLPATAHAQPADGRPPVTIGAGAVISPSPYAGVDTSPLTPVPFINLELGRFYLRGLEAGFRLTESGPLSVSAIVQPRFQSFEAGDSAALEGMTTRRRTAEGGLRAQLRMGRLQTGLRGLTDLLGRHQGQVMTANAGYRLGGPFLAVTPSAGIQWQSGDFVGYYYGVRPDEAQEDRPAYAGGAAANPFVGASARLRLGQRWGVFALVRHYWLDNTITDSPIVDNRTDHTGVVALTRAFGG